MTLRTKTIEYVFDTRTTSLAGSTRHDFTSTTLYIPETVSRNFLSVTMEIQCNENSATGGTNGGSRTMGIKLGAVAFDNATQTGTIIQAFSQPHYIFTRDVTSYFNTNFGTGTSQTCQVGFAIGSQVTQTITAKLYITYAFEDANQTTRVKTVRIPLDSNPSLLTATLTEIGTNQVPILTGGGSPFLPESSIVVRDLWFEVFGNDSCPNNVDFNLNLALDAEGAASQGTWEKGQNTNEWHFTIWRRLDMVTTTTHAFKASVSTASRCSGLGIVLNVTYEYDHDASGTILNSLILIPPRITEKIVPGDSATDAYRGKLNFQIGEPGTITLKQSGVRLTANSYNLNAHTIIFRTDSQSYTTYNFGTDFVANTSTGQVGMTHRVDSGGAAGAGISIARGLNSLVMDVYTSDASGESVAFNVDSWFYLNYTSGKHTQGADAHASTTRWALASSTATTGTTAVNTTAAYSPLIQEPNYWVVNAAIGVNCIVFGDTMLLVQGENKANEGMGSGWTTLLRSEAYHTKTMTLFVLWDITDIFTRHVFDPVTDRLHLNETRRFRYGMGHRVAGTGDEYCISDCHMYVTFSEMPVHVERAVSTATNDVTIDLYDSVSYERRYRTTTRETGGFTFIAHADTTLFAEAYVDGTSSGRSFNFTPSGYNYNIQFTPGGMSGVGLWLRADSGITISSGISAWTDRTTSANNAAQATSGSRPAFLADGGDNRAAANFDGTDDFLDITDSATFASTTQMAVSAWVRLETTPGTSYVIMSQWTGTANRFSLEVNSSRQVVVLLRDSGDTTTSTSTFTSRTLALNTWTHIAMSYDGAAAAGNRVKVYLNNSSLTGSVSAPTAIGNSAGNFQLGRKDTGNYWDGSMDDIVYKAGTWTQDDTFMLYTYRARVG